MRVAERIWGICEICVISVCRWTYPYAGPSFGTTAIPRLRPCGPPLGMTAARTCGSARNDSRVHLRRSARNDKTGLFRLLSGVAAYPYKLMRILLAEDDRQLRESISRGLREASYAVDDAPDGGRAAYLAAVNEYDAILLDVVLPVRDGIDVCRELRRKGSHAPVLMLTARDTVDDKITGLDA